MKLFELVESLESASDLETIYAVQPWSWDCEAMMAEEPADGGDPFAAAGSAMRYFLEVSIAKEVLGDCPQPNTRQKCDRLIKYALTDA